MFFHTYFGFYFSYIYSNYNDLGEKVADFLSRLSEDAWGVEKMLASTDFSRTQIICSAVITTEE